MMEDPYEGSSEWLDPLMRRIVANPTLNKEDRGRIKKLFKSLDLHDRYKDYQDVNILWEHQIKLESLMIYLIGTYSEKLADMEKKVIARENMGLREVSSRDPETGYKRTDKDKEAFLEQVDTRIAVLRSARDKAKFLHKDLQRLEKQIFGLNQKLENLSVNHRRMMASEEKE